MECKCGNGNTLECQGAVKRYEADWESLDSRPVPAWFDEAKFGIFIHWGVYSVPAWGPKKAYAEWYGASMLDKQGETWKHHVKTYGEGFKYQDFAPMFKAEMFNPDEWASLFKKSGARYVVLTSKHHEGFCLWPSDHSWNWNSVDIGPHRDLAGELADSVRAYGLKMGFYYSLYEWFRPLYHEDPHRYAVEHMIPQMQDLVSRYQPSVLFTDGEWDKPSEVWDSCTFLSWLYNESPVKDEIVVNDRWGSETRSTHGGCYTTEYGEVGGGKKLTGNRKWEENRGIGWSFGFNRNEGIDDYLKEQDLIHMLVNIVSKGGNLLLNIGPTADGRIPVIMQERLVQIGEWLGVNGEAIYNTVPWRVTGEGDIVRYTSKEDSVYAICLKWPGRELVLDMPEPDESDVQAQLLGWQRPLNCSWSGGRLHIEMPDLSPDQIPCSHAYVLKLNNIK